MESLKYPIGRFILVPDADLNLLISKKEIMRAFPGRLAEMAKSFNEEELETTYRPGGWTARQVIHHLADSHMNSYIRFKWALTEDKPLIKAYDEKKWAELPDSISMPVDISVKLIRSIHERLVRLMDYFKMEDWNRQFIHPEGEKVYNLSHMVQLYAWHGAHHLAHLQIIKTFEKKQ